MEKPFFTVITVCYNAGDGLRAAIDALRRQTCQDYQHIIKDGGSTDGSVDAIRPIIDGDEKTLFIACPDGGIYDAMNQALAEAQGEYIYFLNCGDSFSDEHVLSDVKRFIEDAEDAVIFNDSEEGAPDDAVIYGDFMLRGEIIRQPKRMSKAYLYRRPLNHQSTFFGRAVFEGCGCFDTSFSVRADHELTLRAYCQNSVFLKIYRVIAIYEGGGFSECAEKKEARKRELEEIRGRYFTVSERKRLHLIEKCGFPTLRKRIRSQKSPEWVRRIYRGIANWFLR